MNVLSALPFVLVLLSLVILPQATPHLWESPRRRGAVLALLGVLGLFASGPSAAADLHAATHEYVAFVVLLASLYVVATCVVVQLDYRPTPWRNAAVLACGTCLASLLGTTGASMLLVQPLLRANAHRRYRAHTVVFFIFLVSNVGGLLLPLGDPPLFLGFLRGVPFFWPLQLWRYWAGISAALLGLYVGVDAALWRRERQPALAHARPLRLRGGRNLLAFAALLALLVGGPALGFGFVPQQLAMVAVAGLTFVTTDPALRRANAFSWAPIVEVAQLFAAIFVTMPPALRLLQAVQPQLPLTAPNDYFWGTGTFSAFLDNAPCYVTFASLAAQQVGLAGEDLAGLAAHPQGQSLLQAVALGAVTMGALTYIGNGPNLMVRSMAQQAGVAMPSFGRYVLVACATLVPVLACARWLL